MGSNELVAILANSSERVELLRELHEEPQRQSDLADESSLSRSSVSRNVSIFEQHGWVERENGFYRLTVVGDRVLETYERTVGSLEAVQENRQFLDSLGQFGRSFPVDALESGTVVNATQCDPHAPLTYYQDVIGNVTDTNVRVLSSVVTPVLREVVWRFADGPTQLEMLLNESTFETANAKYEDFPSLLTARNVGVRCIEDPITVDLVVLDSDVLVGAYDEGTLQACFHGESQSVFDWAENCYLEFRAASTPIEPPAV